MLVNRTLDRIVSLKQFFAFAFFLLSTELMNYSMTSRNKEQVTTYINHDFIILLCVFPVNSLHSFNYCSFGYLFVFAELLFMCNYCELFLPECRFIQ